MKKYVLSGIVVAAIITIMITMSYSASQANSFPKVPQAFAGNRTVDFCGIDESRLISKRCKAECIDGNIPRKWEIISCMDISPTERFCNYTSQFWTNNKECTSGISGNITYLPESEDPHEIVDIQIVGILESRFDAENTVRIPKKPLGRGSVV